MRHFVYSTLTNDHRYTNWTLPTSKGMLPQVETQVLIRGGANRAGNHGVTPIGVRTEVDEEQLEALKKNKSFQRHCEQKLILVFDEQQDPEEVAKKYMTAKDQSAPLTPNSEIFKQPNSDGETIKPSSDGKSIVSRVLSSFS